MRRLKELGLVELAARRLPHLHRGRATRRSRACSRSSRRRASTASPSRRSATRDDLLGVVCLPFRKDQYVAESLLPTLSALCDQAALAVRSIQYNEELARKNEELTHLDELKSDFMATMSHELRTPLTSIIGYSDMMLAGMTGELNEKQTNFARASCRAARRCSASSTTSST